MVVGQSSALLSKFLWSGGFSLFYNILSDLRTKKIDDRWNYYAFGNVTFIYFLLKPQLLLLRIIASIIIVHFIKGLAEGDRSALRWIIMGLFAFDWMFPMIFLFFLLVYTVVLQLVILVLHRVGYPIQKAPYYGVIFGAFITTAVVL